MTVLTEGNDSLAQCNIQTYRHRNNDEENHLFYLNGNLLSLTISETKILTELTDNAEMLLSRTRLLDKCFTTHAGYERIIDTHVKNIRGKIGQKWIETVRGYSYKFVGSLKGCEEE